ncbi:MAG: tetratricopeptide repeat protein [DPANN group archaeon]|nr:tetratricopeptide repeat protein [DPANN group archaeon]
MKPWKKSEDEVARKVTQQRGIFHRDNAPGEDYCMPAENLADLFKGEQPGKRRWFGDQDYIVVDNGPVLLHFKLGVTTKDGHKLEGDLTLKYIIRNELAAGKLAHALVNLFATEGKSGVMKSDLEEILSPRLSEAAVSVASEFTADDVCLNRRGDFYACVKRDLKLAEYGLEASDIVCDWSGNYLDKKLEMALSELHQKARDQEFDAAHKDLTAQFILLEQKKKVLEMRAGMQEALLTAERARVETWLEQRRAEQHLELEEEKERSEIHLRERREDQLLALERTEREAAVMVQEYKEKIAVLEKEIELKDRELLLAKQPGPQSIVVPQAGQDLNQSIHDLVSVLNRLLAEQGLKRIASPELPEIEKKVVQYESRAGQLLPELYLKLGNVAYRKGNFQQAVGWYKKLLRLDENSAVGWNNLGATFDAIGAKDDALMCYDKAIVKEPSFTEAANNKAVLLYSFGQHSKALDLLRGIKPHNDLVAYNTAMAEIMVGELDGARQHLESILFSGKVDLNTYVALGDVCVAQKKFSEAQNFYSKALEIEPKNKIIWLNKLNAFLRAGMLKEARFCTAVLTSQSCARVAEIVYGRTQ